MITELSDEQIEYGLVSNAEGALTEAEYLSLPSKEYVEEAKRRGLVWDFATRRAQALEKLQRRDKLDWGYYCD